MSNNRSYIRVTLLAGLMLIIGILIGYYWSFNGKPDVFMPDNSVGKSRKVDELLQFISEHYVDKINTDSLMDDVIRDIMSKLDPHSVYIPKKESESVRETMQGNFVGLGVEFQMNKDTFTIFRVLDNSPAKKAGLRVFDRIIAVDGQSVAGKHIPLDTIVSKLKGKADTYVNLTVKRFPEDTVFQVKIKREKVPIVSVPAAFMLNDTLGYIRIEVFSDNTYDEFHKALSRLKQQGLKALILDLRGNSGGYLKQANLIADEFLPSGRLIFYTKNHEGNIEKVYATGRGAFEKGPLFVLIDQNTASASEIVAGALQDNDRALIVGRRSYGKGLVQEEIPLNDGSIMRITTARYYTPSGRSIQRPYKKGHKEEYDNDFYLRYYNGELFSKDSIKINKKLKFKTRGGRTVYGGGGIIPDIFVPLDKSLYHDSYQIIMLRSRLNDILEDYYRHYFRELQSMSEEDFVHNDTLGQSIYRFLLNHEHLSVDDSIPQDKVKRFENTLHAFLGRNIYGLNAYFAIHAKADKDIERLLTLPADSLRIYGH